MEWIYSHIKLHINTGHSSEPKDITFPASLLTGALATFGLEGSKKSSKKDDKVAMEDGMVQTIRVITPIKIEGAEVIDPKPKKMKKLLPFIFLVSAPVYADMTNSISSSVKFESLSAASTADKIGSSYSISGNNITTVDSNSAATIGGFGDCDQWSASSNYIPSATQATSGEAFSFSTSYLEGDATPGSAITVGTVPNFSDLTSTSAWKCRNSSSSTR